MNDYLKMLKWWFMVQVWDMQTWVIAWIRLALVALLYSPKDNTVGLSLSLCIKGVFEGTAPAFGKIISSTMARDEAAWDKLITTYCKVYWADYPVQARLLVRYLRRHNAIEQPRLDPGGNYHNIAHTYWLEGPVTREKHRSYGDNGDVLVGSDGHRSGERYGVT